MSHYFFAAKIPTETKVAMEDRMKELREQFPFRRWVHYEDLHITLAFLGAAPEGKVEKASSLVGETLANSKSFPLTITGLGVFGQKDSPRVFWASLSKSEKLGELRNRVFAACKEAGFQLETRPFAPHVTLARNWEGEAPFNPGKLAEQPLDLDFLLDEVVLYRTNMEKTPKYESIQSFSLNSTELQ
ncbi:RNA 2',3'-cyclic phosphodiesterase [Neobacillus piezotolerans]|uniref:RNA 2',3'-cyclic phosphodiesterase n=1 Tax=Neobacillus piezotolerans TaxID=2259171 RepID=A0A3D8GPB0_9BACI|nr:RNA 2',3'-cyclic phosphodiesterase [Neobacillus piezotolerans]RDU36157.1 RNA 2',3'-cyclic phosphodiesterase [Neobacillus piezotolerans]